MVPDIKVRESVTQTSEIPQSTTQKLRVCDDLGEAIDTGKIGDIVAKHEKLILHYYEDVQNQAKQSFSAAKSTAQIGFWVLICTLAYALIFDGLGRLHVSPTLADDTSLTVAKIGIVSGALIEFIAAITFWLYARGSRQFSAFHICLERTHRYLLAYKIADQLKENKDEALRDLVCIMANAPMITREDIDSGDSRPGRASSTQVKAMSAEVKQL
jgi:hypothetical protein